MGEAAEMMTDGTLCSGCGAFIDDEAEGFDGADGIPRYCGSCGGSKSANGQRLACEGPPRRRNKRRRQRR